MNKSFFFRVVPDLVVKNNIRKSLQHRKTMKLIVFNQKIIKKIVKDKDKDKDNDNDHDKETGREQLYKIRI